MQYSVLTRQAGHTVHPEKVRLTVSCMHAHPVQGLASLWTLDYNRSVPSCRCRSTAFDEKVHMKPCVSELFIMPDATLPFPFPPLPNCHPTCSTITPPPLCTVFTACTSPSPPLAVVVSNSSRLRRSSYRWCGVCLIPPSLVSGRHRACSMYLV